ncbi:hypothetical protein V494_07157 [Pseudogymnoascus sp. VKM F-4513 (FW-928)]|nr:hypothetical protein V494_07157 [Pseudogymnoascus sp. VKM F-4513 (FW-928)]
MKLFIPVALTTFTAIAAATDCSVLGSKVPTCALSCVNTVAYKYCDPKDFACSCSAEVFAKIVEESADCVADACEGEVFKPLEAYCKCQLEHVKPTTTSAAPEPTETPSTCDAEQKKIPSCAVDCLNAQAYDLCEDGDPECACKSETLKKIVKGSAACVASECDGKVELFKPLKNWCKCKVGEEPSTSTTAKPTETSTASEEPTETSTASKEPTETLTTDEPTDSATTAIPTTSSTAWTNSTITTTSTATITSCTACATSEEETVTLTITTCPEGTDTPVPTAPGPDTPVYPTTPGSPGTTYIPSATPVSPSQPTFEAAGVMVQQSSGLVAFIAVIVGLAWL